MKPTLLAAALISIVILLTSQNVYLTVPKATYLEMQGEKLTVPMKVTKKSVLVVAVWNEDSRDVYSMRIHANDTTIESLNVRGWNKDRIDSSTFTIHTASPLRSGQSIIILLLLDDKHSNLELTTFDLHGNLLSYSGYSYADQIITECQDNNNDDDDDLDCVIAALDDLSEREIKENDIILTVNDLISKYEQSTFQCHTEGHHLGRFLYDYTGNITKALHYVGPKCGGSVYHKMIQDYFEEQLSNKVDPSGIELDEICPNQPENPYSIKRWECLHGVGHGLAVLYGYDVFTAADRCGGSLELSWAQVNCLNGLFMQNVVKHYELRGNTLDEEDLLYPCNQIDANYAPPCYNYLATHVYFQSRKSPERSFYECDKAPEEFVTYCYFGIGRQVFQNFSIVGRTMETMASVCENGNPVYRNGCYAGLARTIVDQAGINEAFKFCKQIPEQHKAECYDIIGKWVQMLHLSDEARLEECSRAESHHYFEICAEAEVYNIDLL